MQIMPYYAYCCCIKSISGRCLKYSEPVFQIHDIYSGNYLMLIDKTDVHVKMKDNGVK